MNISHIEHVGIAVTSLDEAIPFYEKFLGFKCYAIEEVEDQHVRTAFFKVGDVWKGRRWGRCRNCGGCWSGGCWRWKTHQVSRRSVCEL